MRFAGKTVVVTGAGGFIGSHVVERLAADGAKVRAMLRYTSRGQRGCLDQVPESVIDNIPVTNVVRTLLDLGAVLVLDGRIAGWGPSRVVTDRNPDAHAERVAIWVWKPLAYPASASNCLARAGSKGRGLIATTAFHWEGLSVGSIGTMILSMAGPSTTATSESVVGAPPVSTTPSASSVPNGMVPVTESLSSVKESDRFGMGF